ncbi:gastric triacylglycerol lipase-like isoform X2 [Oratosquilla oratoria]|uniref:gastric triacylglycerol lipase-like isoform X2 n=1 Tax=Oratosquilla oratoria TaxID=337810 RepID=UPI003F777FAC
MPDLIKRFGYSVQVHHVVTEDGYMLELHRIPPSPGSGEARRRPVLLQHGLWSSSSCWLLQEKPQKNLPMLLSDLGYDVWLGNFRGNTYGRRHLILNPVQPNFWSFSWDQMAKYDLPATIDYILKEAGPGVDDLFFVGYSLGARTFVAMMNERPQYNSKVRAMVGLAPTGAIPNLQGFFRTLAPIMPLLQNLGATIGLNELRLDKPSNRALVQVACKSPQLCLQLYTSFGPGTDVNKGFLRTQLQRYQSSTSIRTLTHYTQLIIPGRFAKYDFGAATNRKVYGQSIPPEYHPQAVQVPVYFFSGTADHSADPKDVATLARAIPTLENWVQIPGYNHLDFIMGLHAEEKVYEPILSILKGLD